MQQSRCTQAQQLRARRSNDTTLLRKQMLRLAVAAALLQGCRGFNATGVAIIPVATRALSDSTIGCLGWGLFDSLKGSKLS